MAIIEAAAEEQRRVASRYQLALKVLLADGEGVTRDISAQGIYFACDGDVAAGSAIDFVVEFAGSDAEVPMKLRCTAQVVRVERDGARVGVAAKIVSRVIEMDEWTGARR